ncbi:MAG: hypothetical protein HOO87_13740 [Methyloglobulus sp.]|nr:hypothetical protein [Methyloglobulus sp.]
MKEIYFMKNKPKIWRRLKKMKNKHNLFTSLVIIWFVLCVFIFDPIALFYLSTSIFYGYDPIMEFKVNKILREIKKNGKLEPVSLQNISDQKIIKACIQTPYEPQNSFEEKIGFKVNNFDETDDDGMYVLWFFFSDGAVVRIRQQQMEKAKKSPVCTKNSIKLAFKQEDGLVKLLISGE